MRRFLPPEEAQTIEQILITQVVLILLLVLIAVIFASSLVSNSLMQPLRRLLVLTRLVGEGKLTYRLKVSSSDEIGELTDAFNVMVGRLHEQQKREQLIGQLKSEFISIAAHQLRTPLSAIKWTFRMLLDGDVGDIAPEQRVFLERGYNTNENMIRLVNDLLNVARIEEGRFGFDFKPVNIEAYVQNSITRYVPQAEERHIQLLYRSPRGSFPPIAIDQAKMDLVVQNVLDNAIKYSYPGSVVEVSLRQIPSYVEVVVVDHGVGIPRDQKPHVFTKFFRGGNVIRMQTEGSGLGLFIARNIIKNHGGDITIESEEDKGTTVRFTLPVSEDLIPKTEAVFEEFVSSL
ncbi:MAG TPA: HAMP domain-containing sensor histidine kinase [Candidatus Paceibacterota bacterium]